MGWLAAPRNGLARAVLVLAVALLTMLGMPPPGSAETVLPEPPPDAPIWVSPQGDDAWSGRLPSPSADASDGPKATLEAALDAALAGRHRTIRMETGDWYLTDSIDLDAAHDGMTIEAAPGATPVLHGGPDLSELGWRDEGGGIFSASLDAAVGAAIDRLVLDGASLRPARYPNATPGDPRNGWLFAAAGTSGHREIRFEPGAIPWLRSTEGLRVVVVDARQWTSNVAAVASIDHARGRLLLADNVPWHELGEGSRFFLFGTPELVDEPGEWAWDAASRRLLIEPFDTAALTRPHRLVAGTIDTLIRVDGTTGITIEGLSLRDGTTHGSDRSKPYLQIGGGAIRITDSRDITLADNTIVDVGVGLNLLDVRDSVVRGNTIRDVAGNGIHVGMPWGGNGSTGIRVEDNRIDGTGQIFIETGGIFVTGLRGGTIAGNRIARSAQFGIYAGQVRKTGEDAIRDLTIERNLIREVNTGSADGGGIKLFATLPGLSSGQRIQDNWVDGVTHLMNRPDGTFFAPGDWIAARWPQPIAAGIYLDTNQSGVRIERNVVTRSYGGVLAVDSADSRIVGNVVAGGWGPAIEIARTRDPKAPVAGNRIERNVVLLDEPSSSAVRIYDAEGGPPIAAFVGNLYSGPAVDDDAFRIDAPRSRGDLSGDLAAWLSRAGSATGDAQRDPGFVDAAHGDFRPKPGEPGVAMLDPWLIDTIRAGFGETVDAGASDIGAPADGRPPSRL